MTIAFYLRLSHADGDLGVDGKDESNSIENQRLLLRSYVRARDGLEGKIVEYVDDGFTGTNFNRPAFKQMIEDAKRGMIQIVLVKDLSRLGRDYITVGDYIEQIFPMLNIRFIAANNGFDSATHRGGNVGMDVAVNNLINTFYSRDLSQKIKSAMKIRWQNGFSTCGVAPFGYLPSKTEKGKYEIDPEAAKIVRTIFFRAQDELTTSQIARYLNEFEVPTPGVYNQTHKCWDLQEPIAPIQERKWTSAMVRRILLNYEYTGALVRGKTCNYGVGMKPTKKRHESEWITVEEVNPPIVSKKLFARAGKVIQKQKADRCVIPHEYPLKGKLRCGNCRRALSHVLTDDTAFLICHNGLEIGKYSNCNVERYPAKEIEQVVWRVVRELICLLNKIGPKIQSKTEDKVQMLIAKEMELTRSIKQWKAEKLLQYELYADGSLSKELYLRNREELTERIERAEQTLTANQEKNSKQRDLLESAEHLSGLSRMYLGETELTYEIAQAFVERVFVYNRNRIEIVFRFEDEIQRILQNEEEKKPQERIGA
jgi:DNA invertase Pin-like site-specific DNA recombinase